MDRLSSCYFCGEAFDASLSEYPVVPKAVGPPEDGPTVVLCGDCRRKLGTVIEEVVAATRDDAEPDAGGTSRRDASTNGDGTTAGGALLDDGDGTTADPDDGTATDVDPDDGTATDADGWDSPASVGAGDDESADDASDAGADATDAGASGDGAGGTEPTMTKLEYNKVMRLLQNRPFPVDRGEIREVATSAYDIDPGEFDAVVDAAVERGLLAVENGQFVAPE